jgi:AAA family ATP:ADP antiporter
MFVQLFLTSLVMTRYGVGTALLVLPCVAMLGSAGFLIAPVLLIGSALNTCDNGFSYSINQSAKEALYVPTTRDEKYKAKAFIDMFVQRFAKALAVGLSLVITMTFTGFGSIRWLSLITVVILLVWILAVRYAGRTFRAMTESN